MTLHISLLFLFLSYLSFAFKTPLIFLNKHDTINLFKNKKIVSISPGGTGGFYMLGVNNYIQKHYNLNDCYFYGASAGAWNTLLYGYCGNDIDKLVNIILNSEFQSNNLKGIEYEMKDTIINNFNNSDFNFKKIFIGASIFTKTGFKPTTICGIKNLEQAIDCCIASSHIPLITGGILHKLDKNYVFDGGFAHFPPNYVKPYFNITWDMWDFKIENFLKLPENTTYVNSFYNEGYNDTYSNRNILDKYFTPK